MPQRDWSGTDVLTACFQSLCPACERQVTVYYRDGTRRYWEHAGQAGQCPKSNDTWEPIDMSKFEYKFHERVTNAGKGWVDK